MAADSVPNTTPAPCPVCGKVHLLGGSTRRCSFPQGHVMVPIEPTRAMLDAARDVVRPKIIVLLKRAERADEIEVKVVTFAAAVVRGGIAKMVGLERAPGESDEDLQRRVAEAQYNP